MLHENISFFPTPSTPDLGCFVQRKHGLEIDADYQNIFVDFCPSIDFQPEYHQVYFRVKCGHAAFFQRALIYMTTDASIPGQILSQFPPHAVLGGDYTPRPSDWQYFPVQRGSRLYWFIGQHRNPQEAGWKPDRLVGHIYDIYENGTLSTVHYDDHGGDRDLNDFILEVAVVGRRSWNLLENAVVQAEFSKQFAEKALPKLKKRLQLKT